VTARAPAPAAATHWIAIGPMLELADYGSAGVRAVIDLRRHGRWSLGLGGAIGSTAITRSGSNDWIMGSVRATLDAAYTRSSGRWSLRTSIGGGAIAARYHMWYPLSMTQESLAPVVEASALVSRQVGARWAVTAGPVLSLAVGDNPDEIFSVFAGLRHAL